jgi:hypothetical protein
MIFALPKQNRPMRATISALLLILLTACGPTTEPTTAAPATPAVISIDEQVSGDPAIDYIRKHQAEVDKLFTSGMLQQRNIQYACEDIRGMAEVHQKDGQPVLVRNTYNDGKNRTITDRFYYKDGELFYQFSETLRWEFTGSTQIDQNGNAVPSIVNHVARYRYYIREGEVVKFLKRKFDFSSLEVQPAEEDFQIEEMTPASELSYRTKLARTAIEDGKVDCAVFQ